MPKPLVVIVDDDKELCHRISMAAEELGLDSRAFYDGEGAVDFMTFHIGEILFAIVDIDLPKASGYEVICRVLSLRDVTVIATSGVMDEHYLEVAKHLGAVDAVRKNDDPAWVMELLRTGLHRVRPEV